MIMQSLSSALPLWNPISAKVAAPAAAGRGVADAAGTAAPPFPAGGVSAGLPEFKGAGEVPVEVAGVELTRSLDP